MIEDIKPGPKQQQWLKSLREHPERQQRSFLGTKDKDSKDYKACCLGELGVITGTCSWMDVVTIERSNYQIKIGSDIKDNAIVGLVDKSNNNPSLSETVLAYSYEDVGLYNSNGSPTDEIRVIEEGDKYNKFIVNNEELLVLTHMNDHGYTWPQIADHVEKHFKYYFNKSV